MITDTSSLVYEGLSQATSSSSFPHATAFFGLNASWVTNERSEPAYCCRTDGCNSMGYGRGWTAGGGQPAGATLNTCQNDGSRDGGKSRAMARPRSQAWWHYGSLVSKDYSHLRASMNYIDNQGFEKTYFTHDTRFTHGGPPGFPSSSSNEADVIWSKGAEGNSQILKNSNL